MYCWFDKYVFLIRHIQRHHDANIAKLQSTISALKDLDSLNKNYNLTLTLDDYINVSFGFFFEQMLDYL